MLEIAKLYTDLDLVIQMTTVRTATGDALDTKAEEYGVYRLQATPAKYFALFDGTIPQVGERFYYDLAYFVLKQDEDTGTYFFEAEVPGEQGNNIYAGTPAVPVNYIEGLISATFGEIYEHGSDAEDDESFASACWKNRWPRRKRQQAALQDLVRKYRRRRPGPHRPPLEWGEHGQGSAH